MYMQNFITISYNKDHNNLLLIAHEMTIAINP